MFEEPALASSLPKDEEQRGTEREVGWTLKATGLGHLHLLLKWNWGDLWFRKGPGRMNGRVCARGGVWPGPYTLVPTTGKCPGPRAL